MLTLFIALVTGASAAFTLWLCSIAFTDCFLNAFREGVELSRLESPHERRA